MGKKCKKFKKAVIKYLKEEKANSLIRKNLYLEARKAMDIISGATIQESRK